MYKATIVITAYQAEDSIAQALRSVLDTPRKNEVEVIVVDDCSQDRTVEIVSEFCAVHDNLKLITMPQNTGSPSEPRNMGIRRASGRYISTLDDDDTYDMDCYFRMLDEAMEKDLDFAKGYLIVHEAGQARESNRLRRVPAGRDETIREMIKNQSLTADFLVKKAIIEENQLEYPTKIKIGEDTVFLTSLLMCSRKVEYIDTAYLHYNKLPMTDSNLSSTQRCGDREVLDQIALWQQAQQNLLKGGYDYYDLRLSSGIRNLLVTIVRFSDGISESCYQRLHQFIAETQPAVKGKMALAQRYEELYQAILSGDYASFCAAAKRRLLIAGYDLKFVLPLVPYLEREYDVRIDEWKGHDIHDERQSRACLRWADIIWCEWLLGNAVYYASHKAPYQRLVIRAHRFEITREFGHKLDYSKVDAVFTVSYYFMEMFAKQFHIPRGKMRLLSNYVEQETYRDGPRCGTVFDLGMVGILPSRKGYLQALKLLKELVDEDKRYTLHICGARPEEISWIKNDASESSYYESCAQFIRDNQLEEHVVFEGY